MKKLILFTCILVASKWVLAQTGKAPVKPVLPKPVLKTIYDSASYSIGLSMANFYKQQGLTNLNTALITQAIKDVYGNKPTLLNETVANACMNTVMMRVQEDKVKPAIEAGKVFLATNKNKSGIKTTASGLQYEVIREGTGVKPSVVDTFVVHYRGTLLNGTEFDASYNRNQPLIMPVKGVIPGWTEGLQLMTVGSKYKFYIPHSLAYGSFDNGAIPGGSTLVFEVELLDVKKPK